MKNKISGILIRVIAVVAFTIGAFIAIDIVNDLIDNNICSAFEIVFTSLMFIIAIVNISLDLFFVGTNIFNRKK
jgi:hypothetical protein